MIAIEPSVNNSEKPIEALVLRAAHDGGCTDEDALRGAVQAAGQNGGKFIDCILDAGIVPDESAFFYAISRSLNVPFNPAPEIDHRTPPHTLLPARLALRHRVFPGRSEPEHLQLLTCDPFDLEARQMAGQSLDQNVRWSLTTRTAILSALRAGYGVGAAHFDDLIDDKHGQEDEPDALRQEVTVLEENEEATIMNFVNQIFTEAIHQRATDIHVEPLENDLRIRYRVDGILTEVSVPPNVRLLQASLISRLKIMAHLDIAERRLPQDGRINLELAGKRVDVRIATIPSVNGESVSLRLLGRERLDLEGLGMDAGMLVRVRSLLEQPNGIILVTGPTGCGKSSTLYAFLRELNTEGRRIVTIE
ncbi:MAG: ATPase, T2SS/T4P/T4SS family, partial [Chthoniobacteraceae bacterium]